MNVSVTLRRQLLFWSIALGGAFFDLRTKAAVFETIGEPPAPPRHLVDNILELRTSYNPGALWGFGRGMPYSSQIFAALSVVAALAICYYLFVRGAAANIRLTAALALIMAGALGNCYDRLALGHVRDFVHFHVDSIGFDFPIFNFADNMLVLGAGLLMLLALRAEPPTAPVEADLREPSQPVVDAPADDSSRVHHDEVSLNSSPARAARPVLDGRTIGRAKWA
jgi:signal peptidase II